MKDIKVSDVLSDMIEKGQIFNDIEKAKLGDTKLIGGKMHEFVTTKSGKQDWRLAKQTDSDDSNAAPGQSKADKLKAHLKNTDDAKLLKYAENPNAEVGLRHAAINELNSRGVDTKHIDVTNGKAAQKKQLFEDDDDTKKTTKTTAAPAQVEATDDELNTEFHTWNDKAAEKYGKKVRPLPGETFDDPKFIDRKFGSDWESNKNKRIEVDNYLDEMKRLQPDYEGPVKMITGMNRTYAQFFSTNTPFCIISGDAGVGKSYNLHAVAKYYGKKAFDPKKDDDQDQDYDYVEVGEVKSVPQFLNILYAYKDKTIVFDDCDAVLKNSDIQGLLKKATAGSGKRMIGSAVTSGATSKIPKSFEFTGKIVVLTNKSAAELVKNEDTNAIYSRASKFDVKMTKAEKLEALDKLKYKVQYDAIAPLENAADNIKERDAVFDLIKQNIDKIDPKMFTSRSFQEALGIKRGLDLTNSAVQQDPEAADLFGDVTDWEPKVRKMLLKGGDEGNDLLEKAMDVLGLDTDL